MATDVDAAPVKFVVPRSVVTIRIQYRCTNARCKAVDYVKYFPHEVIGPAINCHQCGAGFGLKVEAMMGERKGMFPYDEDSGKLITNITSAAQAVHNKN